MMPAEWGRTVPICADSTKRPLCGEIRGFNKEVTEMDKYKIGDLVSAKLGTLPAVGTVVGADRKMEKYLVRFSAVQQNWYAEEELSPYRRGSDRG